MILAVFLVTVRYTNKVPLKKEMTMTVRNWIPLLLLLLLGNLMGQSNIALLDIPHRSIPSEFRAATPEEEVPCKIIRNFCLIAANVDGRSGYLILDTGAPGLVLNQPSAGTEQGGVSCTQEVSVGSMLVKNLEWANRQEHDVMAFTLDMDHLSAATNVPILGLLGYDQLRDYEVLLDYAHERLLLYPAIGNTLHERVKPVQTIPFTLQSHLPLIEMEYAGQTYRFIIDTGAASNLISPTLSELLQEEDAYADKASLQGLDGEVQIVHKKMLSGLRTATVPLPSMTYLIQDLDHLQGFADLRIDGLLGAPFLQRGTFSINFKQQQLYLWQVKE